MILKKIFLSIFLLYCGYLFAQKVLLNSPDAGTITNNKARVISINFNLLPPGKYTAEIYSDAADADENANHLTKRKIIVNRATTLKLVLASGVAILSC